MRPEKEKIVIYKVKHLAALLGAFHPPSLLCWHTRRHTREKAMACAGSGIVDRLLGEFVYYYLHINAVCHQDAASCDNPAASRTTHRPWTPRNTPKTFHIISIFLFSVSRLFNKWYYLINRLSYRTCWPIICQIRSRVFSCITIIGGTIDRHRCSNCARFCYFLLYIIICLIKTEW